MNEEIVSIQSVKFIKGRHEVSFDGNIAESPSQSSVESKQKPQTSDLMLINFDQDIQGFPLASSSPAIENTTDTKQMVQTFAEHEPVSQAGTMCVRTSSNITRHEHHHHHYYDQRQQNVNVKNVNDANLNLSNCFQNNMTARTKSLCFEEYNEKPSGSETSCRPPKQVAPAQGESTLENDDICTLKGPQSFTSRLSQRESRRHLIKKILQEDSLKILQEYSLAMDEFNNSIVKGQKQSSLVIHPKMHVQTADEYLCNALKPSKELKFKDIQEVGKKCLLVGESGGGKSVLLSRMYKNINKIAYETPQLEELAIYLEMKTLDDLTPKHLHEFILGDAGMKLDDDEKKTVGRWLSENENKITLLLDGYGDCSHLMTRKHNKRADYFGRCTEMEFIHSILANKLFRDSKVILSSRPHAVKQLPRDLLPPHIITLEGLTSHDIGLIMDKNGTSGTTENPKLKNDILRLCSNPLQLTMIESAYKLGIKTLCGYLLHTVNLFIGLHAWNDNREKLKRICKLAYDGMMSRTFVFSKKDLCRQKLTYADVQHIMCRKFCTSMALSDDSVMEFKHLKLQEFLCALHLSQSKDKFLQEFLSRKDPYRFQIVLKFLVGMFCNHLNKDFLFRIFRGTQFNNGRELVMKYMQEQFKTQSPIFYECVDECDDVITTKLQTKYIKINMNHGYNISGFKKIIHNAEDIGVLTLGTWVTKEDLTYIMSPRKNDSGKSRKLTKVKRLILQELHHDVVNESLAQLVNVTNVQELAIEKCKITATGWKNFVYGLDRKVQFTKVHLSFLDIKEDLVLPTFTRLMSHVSKTITLNGMRDKDKQSITNIKKEFKAVSVQFTEMNGKVMFSLDSKAMITSLSDIRKKMWEVADAPPSSVFWKEINYDLKRWLQLAEVMNQNHCLCNGGINAMINECVCTCKTLQQSMSNMSKDSTPDATRASMDDALNQMYSIQKIIKTKGDSINGLTKAYLFQLFEFCLNNVETKMLKPLPANRCWKDIKFELEETLATAEKLINVYFWGNDVLVNMIAKGKTMIPQDVSKSVPNHKIRARMNVTCKHLRWTATLMGEKGFHIDVEARQNFSLYLDTCTDFRKKVKSTKAKLWDKDRASSAGHWRKIKSELTEYFSHLKFINAQHYQSNPKILEIINEVSSNIEITISGDVDEFHIHMLNATDKIELLSKIMFENCCN